MCVFWYAYYRDTYPDTHAGALLRTDAKSYLLPTAQDPIYCCLYARIHVCWFFQ